MKVVLISPYEIGRQPHGLAHPAAHLARAGFEVVCLDLSLQRLDPEALSGAGLIAFYLAMHTATRIAQGAIPRARELAEGAHFAAYGLYAPMNADHLRASGIDTVLGAEHEDDLVALAQQIEGDTGLGANLGPAGTKPVFLLPRRSDLPPLSRYAHLVLPEGEERIVGFAETTRGCKHLCRHCPVVPVYEGRFRAIPAAVVLEDIRQQVSMGATHIAFGDPDFFNGPTHAVRIVEAMHAAFPELTYDATIKVEHLLNHADLLPTLKATGCLFITSAVESLDDRVLERLAKGHTRADFEQAVALLRDIGLALSPTFVAFTPWTTIDGYLDMLRAISGLGFIETVPPVQLTLRLLIPAGSKLLELDDLPATLGRFDPAKLGYPWTHPDPRMDTLATLLVTQVAQWSGKKQSRREIFGRVWRLAHESAGLDAPSIPHHPLDLPIPRLSEPWYCCAEPTHEQLATF